MNLDVHVIRGKALTVLVTSFFVLFVVMLPRYTDIAKTWFMLLCLTALGYLALNSKLLRNTSFLERVLFVAIIFNFLWISFSFYANGEPGSGASFVWGRHFYFLFLIPLFFLFKKVELPDRTIMLALIASIFVSFVDILIDLFQGIDHRLQGMNPNAFGPIQLCLSALLLFYFIEKPGTRLRWLSLAGSILGIANVVFSESRSTWVTLAVLGIMFAIYLSRSQPAWKKIGLLAVVVLLICGSYQLPMVKKRVDNAIKSVNNYLATVDHRDHARSIELGLRFELWKTGWYMFLENPLLGVGVGGFRPSAQANSERYQVNEAVHRFKYVHNQYLAALATRGVPGLILFLLVIGLPIYIAMSRKSFERDSEVPYLAIIFVCLTYIVGCFTEDHFEGKSATMFVSVILALLLARISAARPKQVADSHL
ncbi:MAG: O-antigen ligase family protein [Gammaproteobacteria bacterium]|nr:O-antigen ligase family protein [Gammaproteobacteria bacterium]